MIDWKPYLQSICQKYAQWYDRYTITDVAGQNNDIRARKPLLFDLQVSLVAEKQRELKQVGKETEILNALVGLRKYATEHVLLVGRPGSGKSTALLRLLLEEAEGIDSQDDWEEDRKIPVLVELRYYEKSILDLIAAFLQRHHPSLNINTETVKKLLRQGNCLLLIDGVNELPSQEAQCNLQKFRQDYQQTTPMIFTTRYLGVGGDMEISKKLEMQPLTETQMTEFVSRYLPVTGKKMLEQLGGRLKEFRETPLMLMMLCSVFDNNNNQIPANLGSVFRVFTELYDKQIKQDIPVSDESRRWWQRLLQHLAWTMMGQCRDAIHRVSTPTEFLIAIPRHQAEEIFTVYLEGKVNCAADCAIKWLDDLLKHHLIQIGAENKIEFRHQLIQEYYAAERFLQEVGKLSDDELQWDYLNYLKWTEPTALMLGLVDDEGLALRVVRLALQVDSQLGAKLAGEVRVEWQEKTVGLIESLDNSLLLKIRFLKATKSNIIIPKLIKLLEVENSNIRSYAAAVLKEFKSDIAIPELIKLLKNENISVRSIVVSILKEIKSEKAIPGLIKLLEHVDSSVRSSAVSVLREIKSETAISGLIQILKHADSSIRYSAAEALLEIKSEKAIPGLTQILEYENIYIRYRAVEVLGEIKSEKAVTILIKLLEDEDSGIRYRAADALGKIKSDEAVPILIKLLEDEDSGVRYRAADALGKIKSEKAIPGLTQILKNENSNIRYSAVSILIKIKSEEAITQLIQLLDDKDLYIRYRAAEALSDIKSEAVITKLIGLLEDKDSGVRYRAAKALGQIKSEEAIHGLIKLLEEQNLGVRHSAAEALEEIISEKSLINLNEILNNQNFIQKNNGENALNALNALEKNQELLKYYKPAPERNMNPSNKNKTILVLASSPTNEARLRLDKEMREIGEGLRRSQNRDKFTLQTKFAVRPDDLRRALLDFNPQIVHFCGHGSGESGLILEDDAGFAQSVSTQALANLFKRFATRGLECVVLNACYSEIQANAIAEHIDYVVGMNSKISDNGAIKFAIGFYDELGAGWSYEDAYNGGCDAIALEGILEENTPVFKNLKKNNL